MAERLIDDLGLLLFPLILRNEDPPRTSICVGVEKNTRNVIDRK